MNDTPQYSSAPPPEGLPTEDTRRRPATWREPTPEEAKRWGPTARFLDVRRGEQYVRNDPIKALRKDFKLSGRQWRKKRKALTRLLRQRKREHDAARGLTNDA